MVKRYGFHSLGKVGNGCFDAEYGEWVVAQVPRFPDHDGTGAGMIIGIWDNQTFIEMFVEI